MPLPFALRSLASALWIGMVAAVSACSETVEVTLAGEEWWGPFPSDLGILGTSYVTDLGQTSFTSAYIVQNAGMAILLGAFYSPTSGENRSLARIYRPESGWAGGGEFDVVSKSGVFISNLAGAFFPSGDALALSTDGTNSGSQATVYSASAKDWGDPSGSVAGSAPASLAPTNGRSFSVAISADGTAGYLGFVGEGTGSVHATPYSASSGWKASKVETLASGTSASQAATHFDGFAFHVLWRDSTGFFSRQAGDSNRGALTITASDVKAFASASDDMGNILALYYQKRSPAPTCSSATTARPATSECGTRLFASIRTAQGVWSEATQVDGALTAETTSFYQASSSTGGIDFPNPQLTYLGSGRFLAAYAVVDNGASKSAVYTRGYTVGTGWDSTSTTIETQSLTGTSEQYRMTNDLFLGSDGAGNAILVLNNVTTNAAAKKSRKYGYVVYRYLKDSGWSSGVQLNTDKTGGLASCPLTYDACLNPRPLGAIFAEGKAVVVVPSVCEYSSKDVCLYNFYYKKGK